MSDIHVIKSDDKKVPFIAEKITENTLMASNGLDVSASLIELKASQQIVDGITTENIQKILIKVTADEISEETPDYDTAAARLLNQQLRKEVYGQYNPKSFYDLIVKNTERGIYGTYIMDNYTKEELEYFGSKIRYDKDDKFSYAGLKQLYEKYLIKRDGKVVESPQDVNMLIQLEAFAKYPKDERRKWVLEGYRITSDFEVSHPTPTMIGMRTPFRRYISCNGINYGDSTLSISRANYAVTMLTASRSGLGMGIGTIRGLGGDIGKGRVKHTGVIPITKAAESLTKSFSQEMRGGGGTTFMPFFHWEIEDYLVLKNNKGTEENRVRGLDHAIQFNELFYRRVINDEMITLFHMNDVPELYDLMGDNAKFIELYENYEQKLPKKKKKQVKAKDIFNIYFKNERFQTGRIYQVNQDNFQEHSTFKIPLTHSNLCLTGDTNIDIKYNDTEYSVNLSDFVDKWELGFYRDVYVKSHNEGNVTWNKVSDAGCTGEVIELYEIEDDKGNIINCTGDHKIYTRNRGYVCAKDLNEDDDLLNF